MVAIFQGTAVFWYNLFASGEGDYSTRHAACPVLVGNKWGESVVNMTFMYYSLNNKRVWKWQTNFSHLFYSLSTRFLQYRTNGYMNEVKNSDGPVQCPRWNDNILSSFISSLVSGCQFWSVWDVCLCKEWMTMHQSVQFFYCCALLPKYWNVVRFLGSTCCDCKHHEYAEIQSNDLF